MLEWIAGLGVKAVAGRALANAAGDTRAVGKWIGGLDLVHLCLLLLVVFSAWQTFGRWSQHRHAAKVEAQLTATAALLKLADSNLATSQANESALKKAIADQNGAISDLSSKSVQQQQAGTKAQKAAAQRSSAAQAASDRLTVSARQYGANSPIAPNCEPSDTLKAQWRS